MFLLTNFILAVIFFTAIFLFFLEVKFLMPEFSERTQRIGLDKLREKNLQPFFENIYKNAGIEFERENEKNNQVAGIDIYFLNNGSKVNIDEKAAAKYYYMDLKTFCLELSACRKTQVGPVEYKGWFHDYNKDNLTQAYVFGYVRAEDIEDNPLEKIDKLEVLLVKKSKLWKYITKCGYPSADYLLGCFDEAEKFGKLKERNGCSYLYLDNGLKIVRTNYYGERPVCLLVSKEALIALSSFHATYEKENVEIHKTLKWK